MAIFIPHPLFNVVALSAPPPLPDCYFSLKAASAVGAALPPNKTSPCSAAPPLRRAYILLTVAASIHYLSASAGTRGGGGNAWTDSSPR